jgi:hypothetical protein
MMARRMAALASSPCGSFANFQIGGHYTGVVLVYVNLKSKPHGQVEYIAAEHERIPAVQD